MAPPMPLALIPPKPKPAAAAALADVLVPVATPFAPIDDAVLDNFPPLPGMELGNFIGLRLEVVDESAQEEVTRSGGGLIVVSSQMVVVGPDGTTEVGAHGIGIAEVVELLDTMPQIATDTTAKINAQASIEREEATFVDDEASALERELEAFALAHPDVPAAFERIDANCDGELTRTEMIKAARRDPVVRMLLGLPPTIRQEDGTRDAFEAVFQQFDRDRSKGVDRHEWLKVHAERLGWFGGTRQTEDERGSTPAHSQAADDGAPRAPAQAEDALQQVGKFFRAAFFVEAAQKARTIPDEDGDHGRPSGTPEPFEGVSKSASKFIGSFVPADAKVAANL